jgi:hypothetical protein
MATDQDERDDRLEALGQWREENDVPNVWDAEYWDGVLDAPAASEARKEIAV